MLSNISFKVGKFVTAVALLSLLQANNAEAAGKGKKKPSGKKPKVEIAQLLSATIQVKKGKKMVDTQIYCNNKTPGQVKAKKKSTEFVSYKDMLAAIKDKESKKYKDLKKVSSAATKACKTATTPGSNPNNPGATPLPDYLSLEPYTGPFTEDHARMLYSRFAYGATAVESANAASSGLKATIDYMTTYVYEPDLEGKVGELNCDGEIEADGDNDNRPCTANGVYVPGVRYGLYHRAIYSSKPFFEKMFLFYHDERMTAGTNFLLTEALHTVIPHISLLRTAAISGDYKQFMRDWNNDHLGHRIWLDGGVNNGFSPNENYAREFWELGTIGPRFLDGSPVYNDYDISQSALAFSGNWNAFHAVGEKVLFQGTPYQAVVEDMDDVLEATFAHPRTAEHLAEDLWKEFINPYPTNEAIQALAQVIRDNNYNILAVMRIIMESKAVFANESQKSLIKHPMDLLLGLMRSTGIYASYGRIDEALRKMGQQPLLPNTVFGWDEDKLAGEARVYDWRNAVGDVLNDTNFQMRKAFTLADLASIQEGQTGRGAITVERVAGLMNMYLGSQARDAMVSYLDNDLATCSTQDRSKYSCFAANNTFYRVYSKPLNPLSGDFSSKIRNMMIMVATLPDYRLN